MNKTLIASEFAGLQETFYFNSAYMGPYPLRTQRALSAIVQRWSNPSSLDYSWVNFVEEVRSSLARLIQVSADRVSINSSTGEAVSFFATGCRLQSGDRVALFHEEYPSDVLPWLFAAKNRSGLEVDFYSKSLLQDLPALMRSLHPKTKFLNISHVGFQDGNRVDIGALGTHLREREIRLIVDTTQGLGGLSLQPHEIADIDLLVCSPYKWMLSPYGQAFAVWSERALAEVVQTHGNWLTQPSAPADLTVYSTDAKPGARRFDRGQSPNILGLNGLHASLSLFHELGLQNIENHNLELAQHFWANINRSRYTPVTNSELLSSIACVVAKSVDSESLQAKLLAQKIDVSVREGNIRISFHLFNTREQVDRLLEVLSD